VLTANYTAHASIPHKHSPDGASWDWGYGHVIAAYYSFIYPERISRPGWLTNSGRFTHISGHPLAAVRAQDSEVRLSETDVLPLCHATNCLVASRVVTSFDRGIIYSTKRRYLFVAQTVTTKGHVPVNLVYDRKPLYGWAVKNRWGFLLAHSGNG